MMRKSKSGSTEVSMNEVRAAMKRMKRGKAVGPDDIPVVAWKMFG